MRETTELVAYSMNSATLIQAGTRAVIGAVLLGAAGFLVMFATTNDVKTLIIAGLTPAVSHLLWRLGIEGTSDARRDAQPQP